MIVIIPTAGSNLQSVGNALDRLEVKWEFSESKSTIEKAHKVILPGVGSAAKAMDLLQKRDLCETIQKLKQPTLGICLGMQLFFSNSTEGSKKIPCLNCIPGTVEKIPQQASFPVPHMGWNSLEHTENPSIFTQDLRNQYYYFVHSYFCSWSSAVTAYCEYNQKIPALVEYKNFIGMQFHPEKSSSQGQELLRRFLSI